MEIIFLIVILVVLSTAFVIFFRFFKNSFSKKKIDEAQNEAIKDLERRITDLMISQLNLMRDSVEGGSRRMDDQIRSFTKETTQIREELKGIQESVKSVSSFQEIFRSPKLRGQWGEASLGNILSQHYPKELYEVQYLFSSGEQVDTVLKLPDGYLLPIDSKFPVDNFTKMVNASSGPEQESYRKNFINDVKNQIDNIAKKYILPSENTVDMAIMYIPAEAVYYEIINNIPQKSGEDLIDYAQKKKVVLTSPNLLYLHLNTIEHWFQNSRISKHTQEIIKRFSRIHRDAVKLVEDFRKLDRHLRDARSAFDNSDKRLSLMTNRVENLLEAGQSEQEEQDGKSKN